MKQRGVPVEAKEGRELHPSVAKFFIGIATKATGIDAEHWDAKEGEGEGLGNAEVKVELSDG
jgi:hypothetical protein